MAFENDIFTAVLGFNNAVSLNGKSSYEFHSQTQETKPLGEKFIYSFIITKYS